MTNHGHETRHIALSMKPLKNKSVDSFFHKPFGDISVNMINHTVLPPKLWPRISDNLEAAITLVFVSLSFRECPLEIVIEVKINS